MCALWNACDTVSERMGGYELMVAYEIFRGRYATSLEQIKVARAERLIYERQGPGDLRLYVYSNHCVFERAWTLATISARGLIVDVGGGHGAAAPSRVHAVVRHGRALEIGTGLFGIEELGG